MKVGANYIIYWSASKNGAICFAYVISLYLHDGLLLVIVGPFKVDKTGVQRKYRTCLEKHGDK